MSDSISTIILAGGASRRMGHQKAALPFGDASILDRMIAELLPISAELIVVAAPRDAVAHPLGEILARWGNRISVLHDQETFAGPVPAVARGLRAAHHLTTFLCSCDLPLLRAQVAAALSAMVIGFDGAIPVIAGLRQPLCAGYRTGAVDLIEAILKEGETRLTTLVTRLAVRWVAEAELRVIDPDLRSFLNVNTPTDYARALKLAGF